MLADAENLVLDLQRAQVFDFNAVLTPLAGGKLGFFASTEEGLLWQGVVDQKQLVVTGITRVAPEGAAIRQPKAKVMMRWFSAMSERRVDRFMINNWKRFAFTEFYRDPQYVVENHPFDEQLDGAYYKKSPPGRMFLIHSILTQLNLQGDHIDNNSYRAINPLLAQPVIDCLLNISSFEHFDERYDRLLLRHVMAKYSNCDIIWRQGKGTPTPQIVDGIQANLKTLKDLTYNGVMVRNGIINEVGLEVIFRRAQNGITESAVSLLSFICAEIFARRWGISS